MSMLHTLAFQIPSMGEWLVIAAFGLLIFGKRLPEVGRSLGKGILEFKKGLKGIEDDVEEASNQPAPRASRFRRNSRARRFRATRSLIPTPANRSTANTPPPSRPAHRRIASGIKAHHVH